VPETVQYADILGGLAAFMNFSALGSQLGGRLPNQNVCCTFCRGEGRWEGRGVLLFVTVLPKI